MPTVKNVKGVRRGVKDTGWLLRHARKVTSITVKVFSTGKAYLYAYLNLGDTFIAVFDDHHFCLEWLCTRRSLRDVKVRFGMTDFVIRQAVRVTDGDGNPYHLIACECDNTHQQNKTFADGVLQGNERTTRGVLNRSMTKPTTCLIVQTDTGKHCKLLSRTAFYQPVT